MKNNPGINDNETLPMDYQPKPRLEVSRIYPKIADVVECLTQQTIMQIEHATRTVVVPNDSVSLTMADTAKTMATKLRSAIEAQREELKKPFLEGGRSIDAAARPALAVLDAFIDSQKRAIVAWNAEVQRKHAEEVRKAQEEARRLQEIENARVREENRLAEEKAAAERKRKQQEEDDIAELIGTEPEVVPIVPIAAPIAAPRMIAPAYVAPPAVSKSVTTRTDYVVEIFDIKQVPDEIGGLPLKSTIDANIKRLLQAKVIVPGARLIEVQTPVSKRA